MRDRVIRLLRWMDNHTLVAFNPAMQFSRTTDTRTGAQAPRA